MLAAVKPSQALQKPAKPLTDGLFLLKPPHLSRSMDLFKVVNGRFDVFEPMVGPGSTGPLTRGTLEISL